MTNDRDLELISAYIDGELGSSESMALKERLLAEPDLRAEYETLKGNDGLVRGFAARTLERPQAHYPELDVREPYVRDVREASRRKPARRQTGLGKTGANRIALALAASLATVMVVASFMRDGALRDGPHELNAALDATLSGERYETEGGFIEPQMTFKNGNGQFCREYVTEAARAVACKAEGEKGDWAVLLSVSGQPPADPDSYQPASNGTRTLDSFIDANLSGMAFDHSEEMRLIEARWRQPGGG